MIGVCLSVASSQHEQVLDGVVGRLDSALHPMAVDEFHNSLFGLPDPLPVAVHLRF